MIDRVEESTPTNSFQECQTAHSGNTAVEKLTECRQFLEITCCQVQAEIRASFEKLVNALRSREKQLLRQVDVFQSQQISVLQSNMRKCDEMSTTPVVSDIRLHLDDEQALIERLMSFGKVTVKDDTYAIFDQYSNIYRLEEYQSMKDDHMNLFKPLPQEFEAPKTIKFVLATSSKQLPLNKNKVTSNCSSDSSQNDVEPTLSDGHHTPHINEWLQQIKAETEFEPSIAEVEKTISPQEEEGRV